MELDPVHIQQRVEDFKQDLQTMPDLNVIRRHIVHGSCFALSDTAYFDLRSKVATQFNLHTNDVYVVGSGKLGFSIAPGKRFRHFCDSSDIDVVVVSQVLFDNLWQKLHYFVEHGGYWERFDDFKNYLFNGWIRPDKFPSVKSFEDAMSWWDFFNKLSQTGLYSSFKIRGAIYRDFYFLESYQLRSVSQCRDILEEI